MLRSLPLLVPALIPSWRFFDIITASPRIEVARMASATDAPAQWQEFRPRPPRLSPSTILRRLFWNPVWNETLFLVSCAERLLDTPTRHSVDEIATRIIASLGPGPGFFRFRVVLVGREGGAPTSEIAYVSPPRSLR